MMERRRVTRASSKAAAVLIALLAMLAATVPLAAAQGFETDEAPQQVFDIPHPDDVPSGPSTSRIINGGNVIDGAMPFLGLILRDDGAYCGGTLIAARVVLTAAQCVTNGQLQTESASRFLVGFGNVDITNPEQIRGVNRILVHPDFGVVPTSESTVLPKLTHDIALVYLESPATLTGNVGVIPAVNIDPVFPVVGSGAIVAGWGDTEPLAVSPSFDQARAVVVDITSCSLTFRLVGQACANGPDNNASCRGDRGGPLFQISPGGAPLLVGISSQGSVPECGGDEEGYERTAMHAEWIMQNSPRESPGNGFVPLPPARLLDSREGEPWGPDTVSAVPVLGVAGVPVRGVRSVLAHVTSVGPTNDSYMLAWAGGMPGGRLPVTAAKNYGTTESGPFSVAGLTNDLVILPVGSDGTTLVYNAFGTVDFVIDVVGYFDVYGSGDPFSSATPSRVLDSRPGQPGQEANSNFNTPWGPGETRVVQIAGVGGVPASGVRAVAAHVTSVQPTENSWLTAWAAGGRPTTAVKNYGPVAGGPFGHTAIANDLLILPVSPGGTVRFYNEAGSVHFTIDVVGWFGPDADNPMTMLPPTRALDSRTGQPGQGINDQYNTPWGAGTTRQVQLSGFGQLPSNGVSAVFANVTSFAPSGNSWLTVWEGGNRPVAASKNFGPVSGGRGGHTAITNDLIIIPASGAPARGFFFNQAGTADFIVDILGYAQ